VTASAPLPYAIQQEVVAGATIAYQDENSAILKKGKKVNHVLHLVLSLLLGIWFWVWLIIGLTGGERQINLSIAPGSSIVSRTETKQGLPTWVKVLWGILGVLWIIVLIAVVNS
jgi:hypothetical protein